MVRLFSLVSVLMTGFVPNCYAGVQGPEVAGTGQAGDYLRMVWGLLIVLGIIYILYGLLKKRFSVFGVGSGGRIQVLEMKSLGGRRGLCLVQLDDKQYLLGITEQSIQKLAQIPADGNFEASLAMARNREEGKE